MNVLIVDDEPFQRESLRKLRVWREEDCSVVGEAADGQEALQMLDREHVELVLTDVRMPVMDGIQLAREVRARFPSTRVVVLSAFDDFHLVKDSFRSGVYDYLLKAEVDEAQIREILSRIRRELVEPSEAELHTRGYVTYESVRQKLGTDCVGVISLAGRKLSGSRFACFGYKLASGSDPELTRIGKLLLGFNRSLPIRLNQRKIAAVMAVPDGLAHGELDRFLERLPNTDEWPGDASGPIVWAAAVNPYFSDICSLNSEVSSLDAKLEYSFFGGWNRLYRHGNPEESLLPVLESLKARRNGLSSMLLKRSFGGENKPTVLVSVDAQNVSLEAASHIKRYFQWAAAQFQDFALQDNVVFDEALAGLIQDLYDDLRNEQTLEVLNRRVSSIVDRLELLFENRHHLSSHAKKFVQSALPGECLVSDVANYLGVTPEHLSRTFRTNESMSLKAYISEQRIRFAQKLMAEGDRKIYEIAEAAGYASVEHFSRMFKKVVGVSPKHYL